VSTVRAIVDRAAGEFVGRFGVSPTLASAAPGRVNLIGEHTDYNQGFVLPLAIDRWCVCVAGPAAGGRSRLCAADIDETVEVSLRGLADRGAAAAGELPAWARYLAGSLVERWGSVGDGVMPELDLVATSTVPVGGGLSSSAAIETAAAVVVEMMASGLENPLPCVGGPAVCMQVAPRDRLSRALDCQRAEHRWAGVPCGLMDQLASSFGVGGHALLIDCRSNGVTPAPMPREREAVLLVINSGVRHELAGGEYAKRRAACESAAAALGVGSLREIGSLGAVEWARLDDEQGRCVRHVVGENARTLAAVGALRAGDLGGFGRLMLESHASLAGDYRVSCRELDVIVGLASATAGVFGARMTGGGFGGCAIVLATPEGAEVVARELPRAYLGATGVGCTVERVRAVEGAGAVRW
jgi:galactokinase